MSLGGFVLWLLFAASAAALVWDHPGVWAPMAIGGFFGVLSEDF